MVYPIEPIRVICRRSSQGQRNMETRKVSAFILLCLEYVDEFHWYVADLAEFQPGHENPLIMLQVGKQVYHTCGHILCLTRSSPFHLLKTCSPPRLY